MRHAPLVALGAVAALVAASVVWYPTPPGTPAPRAPAPHVPARVPVADVPAGASAFRRLGDPGPGDWRAAHPEEAAMSFEEYVASDPVRADGGERTIAFQPVGTFGDAERAALEAAAEFTGIWFDLPARVLPSQPLTDEQEQFRSHADGADRTVRQYRTRWFLNTLLPDLRPEDAVVLLGVTTADIYPGASWNYVFGEADLRRRVGVYSLARYFPDFWGEARTTESLRLALLRTLKVVVHEAGHTFGLEHCTTWECAMNGSNSLAETDRQPLHLCPDCLAKLAWNRGLDVRRRYERLSAFLAAHGLADEAGWNAERAALAR